MLGMDPLANMSSHSLPLDIVLCLFYGARMDWALAIERNREPLLRIVGADYLAGAARSLLDGLGWLLRTASLPESDVVRAVSSAPAKVLGRRGEGRGEFAPGRRADLVRARWTSDKLTVLETISRGRTVWRADA